MTDTRFCVDCKHFQRQPHDEGFDFSYAKCGFIFPDNLDPVSGQPARQKFEYCRTLRTEESAADQYLCGPQGRFFEAAAKVIAP